jgi:hypothetical protein
MADGTVVCWVCHSGTEHGGALIRNPGGECTCVSDGFIHVECVRALISQCAPNNDVVFAPRLRVLRVYHKHTCGGRLFLGEGRVPSHLRFLTSVVASMARSATAFEHDKDEHLFGAMFLSFAVWVFVECAWINLWAAVGLVAAILAPLTTVEVRAAHRQWAYAWTVAFVAMVVFRGGAWGAPMELALYPLVVLAVRFIMRIVHAEWVMRQGVKVEPAVASPPPSLVRE